MRPMLLLATMCLAMFPSTVSQAGEGRTARILERLDDANRWRDHVIVIAHRAGGMMAGKAFYPENSLAAVEASIALGVEMVEIDVQKTRDGVFVVLHDTWLDRTTTCRGRLVERTLADLAGCRLKIEPTGRITEGRIPTLKEMFAATRGRILVNIDNKLDGGELPAMLAIARDQDMAHEVVIKQNLWNDARISEAADLARQSGEARFMPIIADDAVRDVGFIEKAAATVSANAVEMINWHAAGEGMTATGGILFSTRTRAAAARGNWHIWVNTYAIHDKPGGMLAGGRGDELAVLASFPQETYGFWVDRGATMIQTDEPAAAIDWLQKNGWRVPYDGGVEAASTVSIN